MIEKTAPNGIRGKAREGTLGWYRYFYELRGESTSAGAAREMTFKLGFRRLASLERTGQRMFQVKQETEERHQGVKTGSVFRE